MELIDLSCPNCCAELRVDARQGMAKCEYCDSTFVVPKAQKAESQPKQQSQATTQNGIDTITTAAKSMQPGQLLLWIFGFIVFFPIPLSILIWRSKAPERSKKIILAVLWAMVFLSFCASLAD